jgi:methyltransferase (TIGR00027 family)
MQLGKPSRTAWAVATHRAAHQILEGGRIFSDPLALRILGEDAETVAREAEEHPSRRAIRNFVAVRSRFAEDALAAAVERGVSQVVVLGAGLDTFAYRSALRDRLRIFEVDHPATQAWKRERLEAAGIAIPGSLRFAPIDFEHQTLAEGLAAAGFDRSQRTFFTWLGVVPYLSEGAVWSTLSLIASLPNGAHVVFDYSDPPESLPAKRRALHDDRAMRVASLGEPWRTHFEAETLRAKLLALGFVELEDMGPSQIAARYFPNSASKASDKGGHILRATTVPGAHPQHPTASEPSPQSKSPNGEPP